MVKFLYKGQLNCDSSFDFAIILKILTKVFGFPEKFLDEWQVAQPLQFSRQLFRGATDHVQQRGVNGLAVVARLPRVEVLRRRRVRRPNLLTATFLHPSAIFPNEELGATLRLLLIEGQQSQISPGPQGASHIRRDSWVVSPHAF